MDVSNAATSDNSHTTAVTGDSHTATADDSHIANTATVSALLEPEKQNLAKTSVPKTEVSKAVPDEVMLTEIGQLELDIIIGSLPFHSFLHLVYSIQHMCRKG